MKNTDETMKTYQRHHFSVGETEQAVLSVTNNVVASMDDAFASMSTFLRWLPNPDQVLKKLGKDISVYQELLTDPFVKGVLLSRKAGVMSKEWDIDRGKSKSKQVKFLKKTLENLDIYSLMNNILDAVFYGYQVFEYMWTRELNAIAQQQVINLASIPAKPAEWFRFDKESNLLFRSKANPDGEPVPMNKFLVIQNEPTYTNPYGYALASIIYWPVLFKKGGFKFWTKFTEKYGMPWIHGTYNRNALDTDSVTNLRDDLKDMVQDAVIVAPDDVTLNLTTPQVSSSEIYSRFVDYCRKEIAIAILGHSGIAQETPGKLGNETAAIEVRGDIIASDKRLVEKSINELIRVLYFLNFGTTDNLPKFVLYEEEDIDLDLANRDKVLVDCGLKFTRDYWMKTYGLEETDIEEEVAVKPAVIQKVPIVPGKEEEPAPEEGEQFMSHYHYHHFESAPPEDQLLIDEEVKNAVAKAAPVMDKYLKPVENYIKGASSYESALKNIADLYPKLNTSQLEEELAKRLYLSELVGVVSAENDAEK